MLNQTKQAVLEVLFALARGDRPADLRVVAYELTQRGFHVSCAETDALLVQLQHAGLVDAERVRLTMSGLVVAASCRARRANQRKSTPGVRAA